MTARWVWVVPPVTGVLVAVMVALSWGTSDYEGVEALFGLAFLAYTTIGALVASAHPRNPVGWLFVFLGLGSAITETLYAYAAREAEAGNVSASVTAAAWLSSWAGEPAFVALALLLLLFPDGRFVSSRWRTVGISSVVLAIVWAVGIAVDPGPLLGLPNVANPFGVDGAGAAEVLAGIGPLGFMVSVMLGVASVVVRYRAAGPGTRDQIKWLAYGAWFAVVMVVLVGLIGLVADTDQGVGDALTALLICAAVVAFPVSAAVAVLRHRLYDIDIVIKRTLVYGTLTAGLVLAYLGSVLVFRVLLAPFTRDSDLAVAGSTLAVAALFRPLRGRIQSHVDRRFYRSRYDAQRTLEGFVSRLRDELDLDTLGTDLRSVVRDTMQPAHVSIWLRGEPR
jgi:hypothetical protein